MSKIVTLNIVCGAILLISFATGSIQVMDDQQQYGWVYNRTITVDEISVVETIDTTGNIFGLVSIAIMGMLLLMNGFILNAPMKLLVNNYDTSGAIVFDGVEPEDWNIETDPDHNGFKVTLGEYAVSFSKDLLEDKE